MFTVWVGSNYKWERAFVTDVLLDAIFYMHENAAPTKKIRIQNNLTKLYFEPVNGNWIPNLEKHYLNT